MSEPDDDPLWEQSTDYRLVLSPFDFRVREGSRDGTWDAVCYWNGSIIELVERCESIEEAQRGIVEATVHQLGVYKEQVEGLLKEMEA